MLTFQEVAKRSTGFAIPEGMGEAAVPVIVGKPQRQGDLLVLPQRHGVPIGELVPQEGIRLVSSEASGNTHELYGYGDVRWRWLDRSGQDIGVLTVAVGATAYIIHTEEHGANGFGPDEYVVRRQMEKADEMRLVAD